MLNFPNGPTAVSWYQFDVTGGNFPATSVQQQEWTNGGDGLFRWMASIAVDQSGNTAISYATSSSSMFPGIRYAGHLESDPPGNLGQGEATLFSGTGSQTDTLGRWGDYSMTVVDPADGMSFWRVANTTLTPAVLTGTRVSVNSNSQSHELLGRRGLGQRLRRAHRDNESTATGAMANQAAALNRISMVARTPGLSSHVIEEQTRERPMRRIVLNHRYDALAPWALRESVMLNISLDEKA